MHDAQIFSGTSRLRSPSQQSRISTSKCSSIQTRSHFSWNTALSCTPCIAQQQLANLPTLTKTMAAHMHACCMRCSFLQYQPVIDFLPSQTDCFQQLLLAPHSCQQVDLLHSTKYSLHRTISIHMFSTHASIPARVPQQASCSNSAHDDLTTDRQGLTMLACLSWPWCEAVRGRQHMQALHGCCVPT